MTSPSVQISMKEDVSINGHIIESQEQYWVHDESVSLNDLKEKINEELKGSIDLEEGEVLVYNEKWTKVEEGSSFVTFKNAGKKEFPSDEGLVEIELFATVSFDPDDLSAEIVEKYVQESFLH